MKSALAKAIKQTIHISDEETDYALSFFHPHNLKKEGYFLEMGKRCNQVAFVQSGLLRIFYPNDKGEETTCYFIQPNELVTSLSSFTTGNPSTENIQALLSSDLLVIGKQDLENLFNTIPAMQEFGRKAVENIAIIMEKRMALFLNHDAEHRYQYLLTEQPLLVQKVPLQYLASYLGISAQHLSRLRKNL
jgi:CRP/FNR family transcriptional regulator, anaerobic regulatory protein